MIISMTPPYNCRWRWGSKTSHEPWSSIWNSLQKSNSQIHNPPIQLQAAVGSKIFHVEIVALVIHLRKHAHIVPPVALWATANGHWNHSPCRHALRWCAGFANQIFLRRLDRFAHWSSLTCMHSEIINNSCQRFIVHETFRKLPVYIHVCYNACTHTHAHTHTHMNTRRIPYMIQYTHASIVRMCTHKYIRTYSHIHTYIYTYRQADRQAYIHTYIHTYIHSGWSFRCGSSRNGCGGARRPHLLWDWCHCNF